MQCITICEISTCFNCCVRAAYMLCYLIKRPIDDATCCTTFCTAGCNKRFTVPQFCHLRSNWGFTAVCSTLFTRLIVMNIGLHQQQMYNNYFSSILKVVYLQVIKALIDFKENIAKKTKITKLLQNYMKMNLIYILELLNNITIRKICFHCATNRFVYCPFLFVYCRIHCTCTAYFSEVPFSIKYDHAVHVQHAVNETHNGAIATQPVVSKGAVLPVSCTSYCVVCETF